MHVDRSLERTVYIYVDRSLECTYATLHTERWLRPLRLSLPSTYIVIIHMRQRDLPCALSVSMWSLHSRCCEHAQCRFLDMCIGEREREKKNAPAAEKLPAAQSRQVSIDVAAVDRPSGHLVVLKYKSMRVCACARCRSLS
jgi:hypothetical protein